ncbi:MAG: hypothetical protein TR69_WS6001000831 [candidate division WS6 bacterium OLB20]|uniref:Uncharacterized protein n=1 Tax=candidate division WS6 bacterium OLB20 TaxID=1617426 RepID=A0A136LYR9_9BACT|nr:MAG: hypothetical protein TR69_WS6001000831 [candidate division WS6 bacterium OLB20]
MPQQQYNQDPNARHHKGAPRPDVAVTNAEKAAGLDGNFESWHFTDEEFNRASALRLIPYFGFVSLNNPNKRIPFIDGGGGSGDMMRHFVGSGYEFAVSSRPMVVDVDEDKLEVGRSRNHGIEYRHLNLLDMGSDALDLDPDVPVFYVQRAVTQYFQNGARDGIRAFPVEDSGFTTAQMELYQHLLDVLPRGSIFTDILSTGDPEGLHFFENVLRIATGDEKQLHYIQPETIEENLDRINLDQPEGKSFIKLKTFTLTDSADSQYGTRTIGDIFDRYKGIWMRVKGYTDEKHARKEFFASILDSYAVMFPGGISADSIVRPIWDASERYIQDIQFNIQYEGVVLQVMPMPTNGAVVHTN